MTREWHAALRRNPWLLLGRWRRGCRRAAAEAAVAALSVAVRVRLHTCTEDSDTVPEGARQSGSKELLACELTRREAAARITLEKMPRLSASIASTMSVCEMALRPSTIERSLASEVTKQMNSDTISCMSILASLEILALRGSSSAISRATFAIGISRSCSRSGI